MEIPEWILAAIDECVGDATDAVVSAKSIEDLWSAKGRLTGIKHVKEQIVLAKAELEAKEHEYVEGFTSHGN